MSANSKAKGSGFEREIAKKLSIWLTCDPETPYLIYRSSNSGGTFTVNSKNLKGQANMASDLVSVDPLSEPLMSKFSFECKTGYKNASVSATFKSTKNNVLKGFWEQASRDAEKTNKEPVLVFKPLGSSVLIGFSDNVVKETPELLTDCDSSVSIKFKNEKLQKLHLIEFDYVLSNFKFENGKLFRVHN